MEVLKLVVDLSTPAALAWGIWTFGKQKTASDVNHIVQIFSEINRYWDRMRPQQGGRLPDDLIRFNLGQVLSYFEVLSYLINKNIVSDHASGAIYHHIEEVWLQLESEPYYKELVESLISSPTTFEQTKILVGSIQKRRAERDRLAGA